MPINGEAAAQTMLGFGTWRAGYCLEAVWQAYKRHGAASGRPAPTAYVGWQNSDAKHPGDRNPPPGVPVWWGPKAGNGKNAAAGDVVISLGGGRVVATDWPRSGVIGITTIDARERQIGRPYLGWTGDILGVPISTPHTTEQEDDMPLDADRDYEAFKRMFQRALAYDARPKGAGATWELGPTLWERLDQLQGAINSAVSGIKIDPNAVASAIAAAIPDDLAADVVDKLGERLAPK